MANATITGATGLVGSNLAIGLLESGHAVRCTRRSSSMIDHLRGLPIEWVEADINDVPALVAAFEGADVVFHCAAQVTIQRRASAAVVRANVDGTASVLAAMRQSNAGRLVHCSSVAAVAIAEDGNPSSEEKAWNLAQFGLDDGYASTKHASQQLVLAATDVDAVIVNPAYMLGPYDPRPSSGKLIIDVVKGKVPGYTDGVNNFVDVRDVCRGMIAAWSKGRRGHQYILGHEDLTYREAFELIARVAGVPPPRWRIPRGIASAYGLFGDALEALTGKDALINSATVRWGYCQDYTFSSEKARRELDYRPGSLEVAVRDAITWFQGAGMLPRT